MKPIDDKKTVLTNTEIESRFKEERTKWNKDILELIKMLGVNSKLSEAQVIELSYRQIIEDKLAEYRIRKESREELFDKLCQNRANEYSTGYELKLTNAERSKYASNDHSSMKKQVHLFTVQIAYLEECVVTLDKLGFAIRNKIEMVSQQLL